MTLSRLLCAACLAAVFAAASASTSQAAEDTAAKKAAPTSPAELFQATAVWDVHLKFTADQWEAMEPRGGGGPGGRGGGGFFGGGVAPRPSATLAPAVLHFGGAEEGGRLSRDAFTAL